MDITFSCEKCGQSIVIDEAGAGITVDCPKCGKPLYVPSRQPRFATNDPIRIEASSARPVPITTAITPAPQRLVSDNTLALKDGEKVIRQERIHWAVYPLTLLTCAAIFACLWVVITVATLPFRMFGQQPPGALLALPALMTAPIAILGLLAAWAARSKSAVTLTNRRLVINKGIIVKVSQELLLKQIEAVTVRHPLLGQVFNYGTILLHGTGGAAFSLHFIEHPTRFYSDLQDCLAKVK